MTAGPRVVIIGAGIVGCAVADEVTERGWTDVTVLEQGPLLAAEGSTGHAPGLVFQTNASKTMTDFARYTVAKYSALSAGGRVTGVVTETGDFPADVAVCCAGIWGPVIGALAGLVIPLVPMAHQYARTTPLPALSGTSEDPSAAVSPILRHQEAGLYFREHGTRIGVGAYGHRPMPLAAADIGGPAEGRPAADAGPAERRPPAERPFTPDDFEESWAAAVGLLPALGEAKIADGINGLFSFTPDGNPLLGEHPGLRGFWAAEAVWITHPAGVAKALAEWLVDGQPSVDVHSCDLSRFEDVQLGPAYVHTRSCQNFVEVYDILHPLQPPGPPRPLRTSPFYERQQELGAAAGGHRARRAGFPAAAHDRPDGQAARRRDLHAAAGPRRRHPQRPDRGPAVRRPLPGRGQRPPRPGLDAAPPSRRRLGPGAGHHRGHLLHRPVGTGGAGRAPAADERGFLEPGAGLLPGPAGLRRGRPGHGVAAVLRRGARLGALHHGRCGPAAVERAVGGGPALRRHRGRAQCLQQPPAGEGLPVMGHGHDRRT